MRIDGLVRGHIVGNINGVVHAVFKGNISAYVENSDIRMLDDEGLNTAEITGEEG